MIITITTHPYIHPPPTDPLPTHALSTRQVLSDPHLLGNILSSFVRLPGQPAAPPPPPDAPPQVGKGSFVRSWLLIRTYVAAAFLCYAVASPAPPPS